jgi:RNA polymerase sigma factor (TIGR02999 family)
MTQLTELLGHMQAGDPQARDALFASAYSELHRLAHARLRDGGRNTVLDTTCLVHESYLRFVRAGELRAEDRRAFFAYCSQVMRSVIVSSVRERIAQKRGGDRAPLTLSNGVGAQLPGAEETVLAVHEALEALEQADPRLAQVAQMRYFRRLQRAGNRRNAGGYRTHGATRLGEGAADSRGRVALRRLNRPMALSIPQMDEPAAG